MLTANNVVKVYKTGVFRKSSTRALDGISLEVEGGMFGLLGPNGAGKTTFMRICASTKN